MLGCQVWESLKWGALELRVRGRETVPGLRVMGVPSTGSAWPRRAPGSGTMAAAAAAATMAETSLVTVWTQASCSSAFFQRRLRPVHCPLHQDVEFLDGWCGDNGWYFWRDVQNIFVGSPEVLSCVTGVPHSQVQWWWRVFCAPPPPFFRYCLFYLNFHFIFFWDSLTTRVFLGHQRDGQGVCEESGGRVRESDCQSIKNPTSFIFL